MEHEHASKTLKSLITTKTFRCVLLMRCSSVTAVLCNSRKYNRSYLFSTRVCARQIDWHAVFVWEMPLFVESIYIVLRLPHLATIWSSILCPSSFPFSFVFSISLCFVILPFFFQRFLCIFLTRTVMILLVLDSWSIFLRSLLINNTVLGSW